MPVPISRGLIVGLACLVAALSGCDRPAGDRLVVATSWPEADRRRIESEFAGWLDAHPDAANARPIRVEWLILSPGDDLVAPGGPPSSARRPARRTCRGLRTPRGSEPARALDDRWLPCLGGGTPRGDRPGRRIRRGGSRGAGPGSRRRRLRRPAPAIRSRWRGRRPSLRIVPSTRATLDSSARPALADGSAASPDRPPPRSSEARPSGPRRRSSGDPPAPAGGHGHRWIEGVAILAGGSHRD